MTSGSSQSSGNAQEQFDIAPLSWVMTELRDSLSNAGKLLSESVGQDADARSTSLLQAKSFLHQAHGALQVVEVEGVSIVTETVEELVERIQEGKLENTKENIAKITDAFYAILRYLEDLLAGSPQQPVKLFPEYRGLLELKGAERIHPADLFFPSLSVQEKIPELTLSTHVKALNYSAIRLRFEKLLLTVLTSKNASAKEDAARQMGLLIHEIEQAQTSSQTKAFWLVMRAFAESTVSVSEKDERHVKQIWGRINLQIRRLVEGNSSIPERLLRDALFFIAQVEQPSAFTAQIRRAYQLDNHIPADYDQRKQGLVAQTVLAAAKEQLSQVKNLWGRLSSGDAGILDKFTQKMRDLSETGKALHNPSLAKLLNELNGIAAQAGAPGNRERMGLELATCLLFVENSFDQLAHLPANFAARADEMSVRMREVAAGQTPANQATWIGDILREAQQRQTMGALMSELQISLKQVEKALDEHFRDPSNLTVLAPVDHVLAQIGGALAILDQDDSVAAIEHTRATVRLFTENSEGKKSPELDAKFRQVAQNVGGLSFFIETLQNQPELAKKRFSYDHATGVFETRMLEKAPEKELLPSIALEANHEATVAATAEQELVEQQKESDRLLASLVAAPESSELQAQLKDSLDHERSYAALLDDAQASARANTAIDLLAHADLSNSTEALTEIAAATAHPQEVVTIQAAQEIPETEAEIDAELLEIFLMEADEVLAAVRENIPLSRHEPENQEYLIRLRRSFHTLKGSGRMVGLMVFGEGAWSVEQVMNLWLSESRSGTDALYELLDYVADEEFAWVEELKTTGSSQRNSDRIIAAADRVKEGMPFSSEPAAAAPVPAPVPVPEVESQPEVVPASDLVEAPSPALEAAHESEALHAVVLDELALDLVDEVGISTEPIPAAVSEADLPILTASIADELEDELGLGLEPVFEPSLETIELSQEAIPSLQEPEPVSEEAFAAPVFEAEDSSEELVSLDMPELILEAPVLPELLAADAPLEEPNAAPMEALLSVDPAFDDVPVLDAAVEASPVLPMVPASEIEEISLDLRDEDLMAEPELIVAAELETAVELTPEAPMVSSTPSEFVAEIAGELVLPVEESVTADELTLSAAEENPSAELADVLEASEAHLDTADEMPEVLAEAPATSAQIIEFPDLSTPENKEQDNVKRIGDLEISLPLHTIYMAETDEIVRFLAQDFAEWRHEPTRPVSRHAVHASHSLAGSSATVGLYSVQELAHSLENVLQRLERHPVNLDVVEFDLLDQTVVIVKEMLQKFGVSELAPHAPEQNAILEQLLETIIARSSVQFDASYITSTNETLDSHLLEAPIEAQADVVEIAIEIASEIASESLTEAPTEAPTEAIDLEAAAPALDAEVESIEPELAAEIAAVPEEGSAAVPITADEPAAPATPEAPITPAAPITPEAPQQTTVAAIPEVSPARVQEEPGSSSEIELKISDEIDQDLLPVFLEEGGDLLPMIGQLLRSWQQRPEDAGIPQSILRLMHTVKGSARMAGAMQLGQHTHDMETRIENLMHAGGAIRQNLLDDLLSRHDYTMHLFDRLMHPGAFVEAPPVVSEELSVTQELNQFQEALQEPMAASADAKETATQEVEASSTAVATTSSAAPKASTAVVTHVARQAAPQVAAASGPVPLVRVRADILDRLVNQAGEVSISRSKLENEVDTLRLSLSELTENVSRLRAQLREVEIQAETQITSRMAFSGDREFDPLEFDRFTRLQELTRMMAESVSDVATVQSALNRTIEGATIDLHAQARLTRELQQDLMRVRMIPFSSVSERLFRIARQTAKEMDKRVNLDIRGTSVEIDRSVLEKMVGPFEHMLRNAIVHGIESRQDRVGRGKNEVGELLIEIRQEGNEVVIHFTDDGQGLNLGRIRDKAKTVGLLTDESYMNESDIVNLIFEPGFSTASEVTELAGRGVGMDVVRSEAASLGGRVSVTSVEGQGAHFTIHLPLTLAVTQVVILIAGGKTFAVPSVLVEQVQQLKAPALANAYNDGAVMWQGNRVALHYLPSMLGERDATPDAQQYTPILIMKSDTDRVAIHVDQIIGNREVVVKNVGPQLARMIGIAGATVLGSGDIVLILNPVPLAQKLEHERARLAETSHEDAPQEMGAVAELAAKQAQAEPVQGLRTHNIVMVVDDSLTVRRVTQRLLVREGYQVVLAKDGIDALEQLQSITPDVMLVDIEMPRMDGFDLTRNVRSDTRTHHIPIIMITSRTADKHRNYAAELGVNAYFGKPYREDDLLAAITQFVSQQVSV